jgi:hypothetical protein
MADLFLQSLAERWRAEAALLRRRGADAQGAAMESCASDLEDEARLFSLETLTLEQAARETGYSYSAVQKMVRDGTIPNVGKKGAPRVRRGDLPKKPGGGPEPRGGEPDLAELVLAGTR